VILEKEEELMGTTTLAATLNTPMSELRPATMDRILVIEDDSALRKILQRLFSSEGYEVEVVQIAWLVWRGFAKDHSPQ
jgi:PleD family two-component response regulator